MSDRDEREEWVLGWIRNPAPGDLVRPASDPGLWRRVRHGAPDPAPEHALHPRHTDEQQKANDGRFWMGFAAGYVVALVLGGGLWWLTA